MIEYINSNNYEPHNIAVHVYGNPSNKAVVLLHAFSHNAAFFEPLAQFLADNGHYVIAPDTAGRGKSDYLINPKNYNYWLYIDDLFLILNYFKIDKASLFGNSMGGITSILFTEKFPRMVNKIILNDIGVVAKSSESMRIGSFIKRDLKFVDKQSAISHIEAEFSESNLIDEEIEQIFKIYTLQTIYGYRLNYDSQIADAFWFREKQIKIPDLDFSENFSYLRKTCKDLELYVIRGERSNLLDEENFEKLYTCPHHKDNLVVESVGHLPIFFNDNQKEIIHNWLR
jgi:pimeloyl-ACP methyl ester carboxylesterase